MLKSKLAIVQEIRWPISTSNYGGMATFVNELRHSQLHDHHGQVESSLIKNGDRIESGNDNGMKQLASKGGYLYHHFSNYGPPNLIASKLATDLNFPIVTTFHDVQDLIHPENFTKDELKRRMLSYKIWLEKSAAIVSISSLTKTHLIENFGKDLEKKIRVIPHGIDHLDRLPRVQNTFWRNKSRLNLIYAARAWKHKGHKKMILAAHALKNVLQDEDAVLHFTGGIDHHDLVNLRELVEKLGINRHIRIHQHLEPYDLKCLMYESDVMLFGSLFEGFGLPVGESVNAGVPVVAFSNVLPLEVQSWTHSLVEKEDFEKLLEVGIKVGNMNRGSKALTVNPLDCSWKKSASDYLSIYREVLAQND